VFLADVTSTSRCRKDGAILLGVRGPVTALLQRDVDDFIASSFQIHHLAWLLSALENLERLRQRGLSATRSLALRDFALGMEGLDGLFSASLCDLCMNVSSLEFRLNAGGRFNRSSNKLFLLLRTTLIDLNSKNFASLESACFNSRRLVITDSPDDTRQNLRSLRTLNPSMGVQQNGNEIYVAVHCCLPTN